MKLHLPKKFKTALMAAFATVSFTTVSTASLGAAVFAFAGYQAAAEETAATEESAADKAGQEEIRDNIRALQEEQDEEDEREATVDPADQGIMERRAKNLERAGDGAASGIAKAAYDAMEAEIFNPAAATTAAPAQQQTSTGSGELPSDDLGFTSNPYATTSTGNSEPVFEVTPATAATTDFLQETSSEQESTGSSSGSSTPASASGFGGSAGGGSADGGYSPFGLALGSIAPISVGETGSLFSAPLLGDAAIEDTSTYLTWRGNEGGHQPIWKTGDTEETTPWVTIDPGTSIETPAVFNDGNYTKFDKSASVTVQGTVRTGSLQIDAGSASSPIVVTINTPENTTLTADHVVSLDSYEEGAPYTNKIVKTGSGKANFNVDDPNFVTQLEIKEGDATINFNQLSGSQNYRLYSRLEADAGSNVTLNVKGSGSTPTVVFHDTSLLKGIGEYNVAEGLTLEINSAWSTGGGFFLDKETTTINLGSGSTLNSLASTEEVKAKSLTINGTGEGKSAAYFHNMFLYHGAARAVHNLKGNVDVTITTLTIDQNSPDTTMQIDDASSLYVKNMYAGLYNDDDETFLHAFQNDELDKYRQYVKIDSLHVSDNKTLHLGAASTEQGASEEYQEGGDFDIGILYGYGSKLVLENNIQGSNESTCLTEVFYIGPYDYKDDYYYGTFTEGYFQLAASNDGTETNRKQTILVLRDAYTTQYNTWELKDDAQHSDYFIALAAPEYADVGTPTIMTNGIRDVDGYELKEGNKAMIYSGTIGMEKDDKIEIDRQFRNLQIYAADKQDYTSSFGISEYINIKLTGNGKQTFTGDFSEFDGNIYIGGDSSAGTLNILKQATEVTIRDLTIKGGGQLNVKDQSEKNQDAIVKGTLLAMGGATEKGVGTASVLNGDLTLAATSTLDVSAAGGKGGLDLGGALTINTGAQLSGDDLAAVGELGWFGMYDLAFGVTDVLGLGEDIDWSVGVDATEVFANEGLRANEYYVRYSQGTAGGNGNNVGTVYIYRIPEPTTGTLSLLALAALAARRRRK